jgi:hypothetical protein
MKGDKMKITIDNIKFKSVPEIRVESCYNCDIRKHSKNTLKCCIAASIKEHPNCESIIWKKINKEI